MILLQLFIQFFKVGLFAIGGGLATLPFLYELQKNTDWYTLSDIANMIAVSESTPGPLGINMATYVGNISAGLLGGVIATLGLITPSIIIICIISNFLIQFEKSIYVKRAMHTLRAASVSLITAAGVGVMKVAFLKDNTFTISTLAANLAIKNILLAIAIFIIMKVWKKAHPIVMIILSGICGFLFKM